MKEVITEKETQWVIVHNDEVDEHMTMSQYQTKPKEYRQYIKSAIKIAWLWFK